MGNEYDKQYTYKGYNVKVKYNNEKSFENFLYESIDESFVPKVINEINFSKKLKN